MVIETDSGPVMMFDFLSMQESVEPKETEYGSDYHNGKFDSYNTKASHFVHTFLSINRDIMLELF